MAKKKNKRQNVVQSALTQKTTVEENLNSDQTPKEKSKERNPFIIVNTKYRNKLVHQISDDTETRKKVLEMVIRDIEDISEIEYKRRLREKISNLLSNLYFVKDSINHGLNPFVVAENLAIAGKKQTDLVLKKGIRDCYKDFEEIKHELFSEAELAQARYASLTGQPTESQLTELSGLIKAIKQIPGFENTSD